MRKPRLFIGSSKESLHIAYAAQENLDDDAEVTVWTQGVFEIARYNLEVLLSALDSCDYGLFIFAADDVTRIRGEDQRTVRDNVLFELGLFIGRLGRHRSFIFVPSDISDLHLPTDLLGITVGRFNAERADRNMKAALGPACHKVRLQLHGDGTTRGPRLPPGLTLLPREEFTTILLEKLGDRAVKNVRLVTYTAEVDAGDINRFKVKGSKNFEVFKRSIVADLAEQQEVNLRRLAAGTNVKLWEKRAVSRNASENLSRNVPTNCKLVQRFYYSAPSKRLYMFDEDEAVIAYYEVIADSLKQAGSLYKGMIDAPALRVRRESPLAVFLLDETTNFLESLRQTSRSWEEERSILDGGEWRGYGKRPCVSPQAVLLDLDGVLYDSLPLYKEAWKEAFQLIEADFPEVKVYSEEGRRGEETIREYLKELGRPISEEEVARIHNKKNDVLSTLGPPPLQKGALQLVEAITRTGLDIWVVTGSSNMPHLEAVTRDFKDLLKPSQIISGRDVKKGKPNPEPYLLCCERAGCHAHNAIVVENAPLGVRAADLAGTFCIAVNTGILPDEQLLREGARAVFKSCKSLAGKWPELMRVLQS
ncbi:MAG TPA: TIR domain-containing protein [Pyrinomonadaceae bacterium]|nr:TIR domain-containing protein [Pyrinomonadaceae bacterium]